MSLCKRMLQSLLSLWSSEHRRLLMGCYFLSNMRSRHYLLHAQYLPRDFTSTPRHPPTGRTRLALADELPNTRAPLKAHPSYSGGACPRIAFVLFHQMGPERSSTASRQGRLLPG